MKPEISWKQLLEEALTKPGSILAAYTAFHDYSSGNQMLAYLECVTRGIPVGPIATYPGWQAKKRQVRKGEKAIALWMPITGKRTKTEKDDQGTETSEVIPYTRFIIKNNWFVLSQTDGEAFEPSPIPDWDRTRALAALGVTEIAFSETDGNVQGYALAGRKIAVNPVAAIPDKTTFHELGHVLMHENEEQTDSEGTPRTLREVEAESVALLCCESLGLPGAEYCRGYIQSWAGFKEMPEKSVQKIFKAADAILKAGRKASL